MAKPVSPYNSAADGAGAARGRRRLVLADDHAGMLEEVSQLLSGEFDVVQTAGNGLEMFEAAEKVQPDAVVCDINMPVMDGIHACELLRERGYQGAVVLLTMHAGPELIDRAFRAGARAYVLKTDAGEDLIPAVYAALEGCKFRSRSLLRKAC